MIIIFLLIPLSIVVAAGFLLAFIWAVRSGQYDDTCTPAMRVLVEERAINSGAGLPLTLTLSPGEREQPLEISVKLESSQAESGSRFARTAGAFLPLAAGEGRGEGERGVQTRI